MRTASIAFSLGLLVVAACAHGRARKYAPDEIVTYKSVGEYKLQLHVFSPPDHNATDAGSCIIFFFGGGWVGGSPTQFYPH